MLERRPVLPLEILLSSIDRLWISSAADYPYRVRVPVKVGIRIPHSTFDVQRWDV